MINMQTVCFTIGDTFFDGWAVVILASMLVGAIAICCFVFLTVERIGGAIETEIKIFKKNFMYANRHYKRK